MNYPFKEQDLSLQNVIRKDSIVYKGILLGHI